MYIPTCYAVSLLILREKETSYKRVEDLLLIAMPRLLGVSVASSPEELAAEYGLCSQYFSRMGCDIEAGSPGCRNAASREVERLEEVASLLAGTPLPYYLEAIRELLDT